MRKIGKVRKCSGLELIAQLAGIVDMYLKFQLYPFNDLEGDSETSIRR